MSILSRFLFVMLDFYRSNEDCEDSVDYCKKIFIHITFKKKKSCIKDFAQVIKCKEYLKLWKMYINEEIEWQLKKKKLKFWFCITKILSNKAILYS